MQRNRLSYNSKGIHYVSICTFVEINGFFFSTRDFIIKTTYIFPTASNYDIRIYFSTNKQLIKDNTAS